MDFGIKGKIALVAAASRGLGRGCAEQLAAETGSGLQDILFIDDKSVPLLTDLRGADDVINDLGIDGGPENPGFLPFAIHDGNNKVREFSKAQEYIADIDPFGKNRLEPILFPVIYPF